MRNARRQRINKGRAATTASHSNLPLRNTGTPTPARSHSLAQFCTCALLLQVALHERGTSAAGELISTGSVADGLAASVIAHGFVSAEPPSPLTEPPAIPRAP